MDAAELGTFLASRRARVRPADVGLPTGPRRRVPGLRRDEVATLAGASVEYYTELEQGRGSRPSTQMLAALARALRLTLDERDHLFRLAGENVPARVGRGEHVSPALLRVLDRLEDTPALVLSDLGDTLVQNRVAVALLGDHSRHTGLARSGYYRWFADPDERRRYPEADHAHQSRLQAAGLRAALSRGGTDRRAAEIVRRLLTASPEFAEVWERHEVSVRFDDHKTLVHPELGALDLDCQALFTENQAQVLLVLTAAPGTSTAEKLELLSVIGSQSFA